MASNIFKGLAGIMQGKISKELISYFLDSKSFWFSIDFSHFGPMGLDIEPL